MLFSARMPRVSLFIFSYKKQITDMVLDIENIGDEMLAGLDVNS